MHLYLALAMIAFALVVSLLPVIDVFAQDDYIEQLN